ncbi:MAG: hypothetical protein JSU94_00750 [Phycisphaerales bacterium]|nr:MAG: hypothetical protein JSU94_00750 [Phycisphaerales bacterium]
MMAPAAERLARVLADTPIADPAAKTSTLTYKSRIYQDGKESLACQTKIARFLLDYMHKSTL